MFRKRCEETSEITSFNTLCDVYLYLFEELLRGGFFSQGHIPIIVQSDNKDMYQADSL